ncbi:MAG: thioredoxin family protein [Chloroflexota bacterium]
MLENASSSLLATLSSLSFREYLDRCQLFRKFLESRYNEARLTPETQNYFVNYPDTLHWVVVVEEENPDVLTILPILQRVIECSHRFRLHIFQAEEESSLLESLVDDADIPDDLVEVEVPLLLLFDEDWNYLAYWGPRPTEADHQLEQWLQAHPNYEEMATDDSPDAHENYLTLMTELTGTMRIWYNSGLDKQCVTEFYELLTSLQEPNQLDISYDSEDSSERVA